MKCAAAFANARCELEDEQHGQEWHRGQLPSGTVLRWRTLVTTEAEYLRAPEAHKAIRLPLGYSI